MPIFDIVESSPAKSTTVEKSTLSVDAKSTTITLDRFGQSTGVQSASSRASKSGVYTVTVDVITNLDGVYGYAIGVGESYGEAVDDAITVVESITNSAITLDGESTITRHKRGQSAGTVTVRYYDANRRLGVKFSKFAPDAVPSKLDTVRVKRTD